MGSITDTRMQVLPLLNEVREKLGYKTVSSLTQDAHIRTMLEYLNDVIDIISDFSDWQEMRTTVTVTASSSVYMYLVDPVSAPVKNIREVAFQDSVAPLRLDTIDNMRRWRRSASGGTGCPRYWIVNGVDNTTTGNPYIEVYPQPGAFENNKTFNILLYKKPPIYTSSDANTYIPFPARMIISGVLAYALLDESRGTNNVDFLTQFKAIYTPMMEEAYNRLNGDSGTDTQFVPMRRGFRRA